MRRYDSYYGFIIFAGPAESIAALQKELSEIAGKTTGAITGTEGGKYARLDDVELDDIPMKKIAANYPDIEGVYCSHEDKYGYNRIKCTFAGSSDAYDIPHFDSEAPDWLSTLAGMEVSRQIVTIELKNGEMHSFHLESDSRLMDLPNHMKHNALTVTYLAKLCCPYRLNKRVHEFLVSFFKRIPSADSIAKICLRRDTATRRSIDEVAEKLEDPSTVLLLKSYAIETTEYVCDLSENTVSETRSLSAMLYSEGDEYRETLICRDASSVQEIKGTAPDWETEYIMDSAHNEANCVFCLTKAEQIEIPTANPTTGYKVVGIRTGCFSNCPSLKTIVIPASVVNFEEGCFSGAKKLTRLVFKANGDASDYSVISKNKLLMLVTAKPEYTIPKEISAVGNEAFKACPKLNTVVIQAKTKLLNESLCGCSSLKTVALADGVRSINIKALEKAGIKELILGDGKEIRFLDKYMYDCLTQDDGIAFSYETAARQIQKASTESNRFKICMELLQKHPDEVKPEISALMEIAVRYCIGKGDTKALAELFDIKLDYSLDYSELVDLANRTGAADISALILSRSGMASKKTVLRTEVPAPAGPRLYIRVRFEDSKAYSYFCGFQVKPGDKVFVGGKKAGQAGEVAEILPTMPTGRAAMYTLSVETAFNVTREEADDLGGLDDLDGVEQPSTTAD